MNNNRLKFVFFILSLLLLGCEQNNSADLHRFVTHLKQVSHKKNVDSTLIILPSPVTYQATTLRSPFQTSPPQIQATKQASFATPLQAYPINIFRFVGIIVQGNTSFAYVLTPDNMVYQVKEGDIIGNHQGRVISIHPMQMVVMEPAIENHTQVMHKITLQLKDIE